MSLINEALKKAQRQRSGEAPPLASMPSIGGESPAHIARGAKPSPLKNLLLPLGLAGAALAAVALTATLFFRSKPTTQASPPPQDRAQTPPTARSAPTLPAPHASTPDSAKSAPAPAATKPADNLLVLPVAAAPSTPAQPESVPIPASAKPLAATPPASAIAESPKPPPPKLEPRAINFIESIRVAGIRASATDPKDSKVLMNDRVYRIGNTVEAELGLRLVEITANSLTFEDERGGRYTRTF